MRYGANPHQAASLYGDFLEVAEPLHGKELSYNNVVDIDAALALAEEFRAGPDAAVAILKHNTPCGVGLGRDPLEAWKRAYATDPESPFGGIVVSTRPWTLPLAWAVDEIVTEVLIAPDFEPEALELLRRKKQRRLVRWHPDQADARVPAIRGVARGVLVQDQDRAIEDPREARVVTKRRPTPEELLALAFAWRVVKHVKSNAIAFTTADRTLALGGGQTSRVEPVRTARARAERLGISLRGSVVGSDAFFPFPDGLEEALEAGATAVIQPGGSTRDEEVIPPADARGAATRACRPRSSACSPIPTTPSATSTRWARPSSSRPTASPAARASSSAAPSPRPRRRSTNSCGTACSATRGAGWSWRSSSRARRSPSWRSRTARPSCRSPPHRTTSACSTATRGRTPAAWGPTPPRRSCPRHSRPRSCVS